MNITFVSNFLNHHQLPICNELIKREGINFCFVATQMVPEERINLGYKDMNATYSFVIEPYKSDIEKKKAIKKIENSDVVIIGSAPESYIKQRIKENRLTIKYSERILKKNVLEILNPKMLLYLILRHRVYRKKNVYMLCSSAYAKNDFSLVRAYKNKFYKWGYFPETKYYDINELIEKKEENSKIEILWVARFIDWKHPEIPVQLAKQLKGKHYNFKIKMIGTGILENNIKNQIKKYKLSEYIEVIGAVASDKVREYMEKANIFIATSDRNEGWGAVVNEAMNSGCAVVANKKIGAVPYLIENTKNGLIYSNKKELFNQVENLINNKEQRKKIGKNAYKTITNTWNSKTAVENLLILINDLSNNKESQIHEGPCSRA